MPKKNKTKIASPIKSQKGLEIAYRKQLNKLGKVLVSAIRAELLPYLKANESTYVADESVSSVAGNNLRIINQMFFDNNLEVEKVLKDSELLIKNSIYKDGIGDQLNLIFQKLNATFTGTATASFAQSTASNMVEKVSRSNKGKFDRSIHRATGVNLGEVITAEGLEDFISLSVNKNVSLIKSLPEEYLKQVETIVNNGVVSGARYSTIEKQITAKVGSTNATLNNRIKTIARNEIQTINSQITLRRSEALGIKKGIYRTSEDERVRPCHAELNGVEYDLSKGAWSKSCQKFIQPGITDINCRCSYSPIINVDQV